MTTAPVNQATKTGKSFEQFLLQNGFLSGKDLDVINLEVSKGGNLNQLLLAKKIIDEENLAKARAAFFNIPYVDLRKTQVSPTVLSVFR
jgi:hypothetical protein